MILIDIILLRIDKILSDLTDEQITAYTRYLMGIGLITLVLTLGLYSIINGG